MAKAPLVRPWTSKSKRATGKAPRLANGYRSGLEAKIAKDLEERGVPYEYETMKVGYSIPERDAKYTPDFILPNGIIVEAKGIFDTEDRHKHVLVKKQHPHLDIRFVFSRSSSPIYKGSPTSLASWCVKNGFLYADKTIPEEWIKEKS